MIALVFLNQIADSKPGDRRVASLVNRFLLMRGAVLHELLGSVQCLKTRNVYRCGQNYMVHMSTKRNEKLDNMGYTGILNRLLISGTMWPPLLYPTTYSDFKHFVTRHPKIF